MIDFRLTNEEAIQLQGFLSSRNLFVMDAMPEAARKGLLNAAKNNAALNSAEQKLTAELDNLLQAQNLRQQYLMAEILQKRADTNDE